MPTTVDAMDVMPNVDRHPMDVGAAPAVSRPDANRDSRAGLR